MHTLALALFHDHELTIKRAVDLQSSVLGDRRSLAVLVSLLGGDMNVDKDAVSKLFKGDPSSVTKSLALRAWATRRVATLSLEKLQRVTLIDTEAIPIQDLTWLAKITRVAWCLHALKPTRTENDVSASFTTKNGSEKLQIQQTRFKTRLRKSPNQTLEVRYGRDEESAQVSMGRTARVNGKSAEISVDKYIGGTAQILGIVTKGRDDPTAAEKEREDVVLEILQGTMSFFSLPLVQQILRESSPNQTRTLSTPVGAVDLGDRTLNNSQATAVYQITSDDPNDQLVLVHGPPGTGKTTVIASSVIELVNTQKSRGIWLVAQSNIAVKNIAEKLADVDFLDFKILVSQDFHFEWHEHLYTKIGEQNVICSDEFSDDPAGTDRLLLDSKVILCTISMLSTPRLVTAGFTRLVPVETVIVDEASQIELGGYLPMLARFGRDMKKLVFIGDDKQLAPFGQEDLGNLASIFEQQHLRRDAVFLDTQYRMPKPIGAFISKHVYGGQLNSVHTVTSRRSCILVDVSRGEETKSGNSWTNTAEADIVIAVAKKFDKEGKKYRIITPYDAQRNLLEKRLGIASLPWEDKCYNVDSFQGAEPQS
ncbi:hypothetical protein FOMPIDRAFT_88524 [Fomitopsis schrenkii]|uniref:DNA2/NAM7 helicase-like C-terminal domain-containing protein n=1 Tax=Fomitopsis schrenkii TaxID=2126942 RepID=S8DVK2_FOMSC|nr:hypothetical protein FOMPIDRAFT_88524 [Fomitopsis schrenkii]